MVSLLPLFEQEGGEIEHPTARDLCTGHHGHHILYVMDIEAAQFRVFDNLIDALFEIVWTRGLDYFDLVLHFTELPRVMRSTPPIYGSNTFGMRTLPNFC